MSPVLLDHRNLKWIGLSVGLLVFLTFLTGYISGFEKSNNKWMAKLDPVEIAIPTASDSDLLEAEAQTPEFEEPGANIDVDSVDKDTVPEVVEEIITPAAEAEESVAKTIDPINLAAMAEKNNTSAPSVDEPISNIAEDVGPLPELSSAPSSNQTPEESLIVDDASEDTARYAVQVGMYSNPENAAIEVDRLLSANLNAYLNEYQNKKGEMRYHVRFGYFSSFESGSQALKIYQDSYAGTGYVARIER